VKLSYRNLREHLDGEVFAPAYLITGNQDLLCELASKEIQEAALSEEDAGFNLDRFDGETATIQEVIGACNMFPLMAARRLVRVRRASKLTREADATVLLGYLESPSPQSTLLLELEKPPDGRRKSWKAVEKKAVIVQCDPLKDREVESWLTDRAKRLRLKLGRDELRYMVGEFGSDLRRQLHELEKISLYSTGGKADMEDLAVLLGRGKAQSIFQFTEAVANRDRKNALKQLGRLLAEGESPLPILALIDRTIVQLLAAQELQGKRRPANAAGMLGVPPWKVERVMQQCSQFTEERLLVALDDVHKCDLALKTTGVPARLLLEGLVISLCKKDVPRRRTTSTGAIRSRR
jgi:DNA polymerase-3 subunit delta